MSNDFENQNDGMNTGAENDAVNTPDNSQNPYQQNYTNPYQQDYSNQTDNNAGQNNESNNVNGYDGQPYNAQGYNGQPYNATTQTGYNGQPYNAQFSYYNNAATGSAPLDKNGQPLKNRFGMKLTFSILEIISCNLITLILGIVSCVFTCKANTAYKQGKWEEFKSSAKTSAITLWVGFATFIVGLISTIVLIIMGVGFFGDIYDEIYNEDDYYYDDDDYNYYDDDDDDYDDDDDDYYYEDSETESESEEETESEAPVTTNAEGSGFVDPTVSINGVAVKLPMKYADFSAATGYTMDAEDLAAVIEADDYDITSVYDAAGTEVCDIWIYNLSDAPLTGAECDVAGFIVYSDEDEGALQFTIQNGITFSSTKEDILNSLGEPDGKNSYESTGSTYEGYTWKYENENATYFDELKIDFVNDQIYCIEVDNTVY